MANVTVDAKRRVELHGVNPGDQFEIQSQSEGRLLLVRIEPPIPEAKVTPGRCLQMIAANPLRPSCHGSN